MGVISAGLGCGTTVYFELPLFCAAMAGKEELIPIAAVQPPRSIGLSGTLVDSVISNTDSGPCLTPQRTKPRPSSPPLTGSAIFVVDVNDTNGDGDASLPAVVRWKRKSG